MLLSCCCSSSASSCWPTCAGGFQLFDGVVNHKVFRLHQIRYDVDLVVYDALWIGAAVVLLLAGAVLGFTGRRRGLAVASADRS